MKRTAFILLSGAVVIAGFLAWQLLPQKYNPFGPLSLDDPPGRIMQYKLHQQSQDQCEALLEQANQRGWLTSRAIADSGGPCPLKRAVRVSDFGPVRLSRSFLASCPLALSSALFIHYHARPLTRQMMKQELRQIDHLGSFACRNIYHLKNAPLSEHATADALDVSAFRLDNGQKITVLRGWKQSSQEPWLRALLAASCRYYGNGLGPDYNAPHANHFHLGMRGYGACH